jgi:transposase
MAPLHPTQAKKNAFAERAEILYEDEASYRKDPTLYQTWSRVGSQPEIPTTGSRESCKVFGAVNLYTAQLNYRTAEVFNTETYVYFLDYLLRVYHPRKIFLIVDNASYHKNEDVWDLLREARGKLRLWFLPPYSPELNGIERVWHHVRMQGTHNRYFETLEELRKSLRRVFSSIQASPSQIRGYLAPFIYT